MAVCPVTKDGVEGGGENGGGGWYGGAGVGENGGAGGCAMPSDQPPPIGSCVHGGGVGRGNGRLGTA